MPVDDNEDNSCDSEEDSHDELNMSINSWDMVDDCDEAIKENSPPGPDFIYETDVAEDNLEAHRPTPNKSEICHTLQQKEEDSCKQQQVKTTEQGDESQQCSSVDVSNPDTEWTSEEIEQAADGDTLLTAIATGCADFGRDVWALWSGK